MAREYINKSLQLSTGEFWLPIVQKPQPKTSNQQQDDFFMHFFTMSRNGWLQ